MLVIVLLGLAILVWLLAQRARSATGLPPGVVVYADTGGWTPVEQPLFSATLQLTGKPDYLIQRRDMIIPVEVKSAHAPTDGPYAAHIFQLAAYCALVSETYGRRPDYGLIQYADQTLAVDYSRALEIDLLELLEAIRADSRAKYVGRSHESPGRCRACGFLEMCGEAMG